jgi:bifunctional DNA-binding transcriptional regulator/antitoxin component of YhaV-PrlF toxin-antitoxin module
MDTTAEKVLYRKFIRMRERNQITLPAKILEGLPIQAGGFLEIGRTADGSIYLKPTILVTANSPEALREESLADNDIAAGRFRTFSTTKDLMGDIKERRKDKGNVAAKAASAAYAKV